MRFVLRRYWLTVHRWIGLTVGLLFVLISLTGSLLVFDHAIDEWLNPDLLLTDRSGTKASLEEVIAAAENGYVGPSRKVISLTVPRVPNGVWTAWFSSGTEATPLFTAVYVDPCTAQVTGQRVWGEDLMSWIYRLHFRLLAGENGATIVGIVGILLFVSICSGILLWWPLWKNGWRAAFAVRSGTRFIYDLHKTLGILIAVFLLVIAFTGVYMEFPNFFQETLSVVSEKSKAPEGLKSASPDSPDWISPDEAVAIAQDLYPEASFDHMHPADQHGVYEVALRQSHEVQQSYGRTQVFLDSHTGDILATYTPEDFSRADVFFSWQFPLHNGEAFGLFGRWVILVTGFIPAVLYVTGVILWWRRRRVRIRQRQRAPSGFEDHSISSPVSTQRHIEIMNRLKDQSSANHS